MLSRARRVFRICCSFEVFIVRFVVPLSVKIFQTFYLFT